MPAVGCGKCDGTGSVELSYWDDCEGKTTCPVCIGEGYLPCPDCEGVGEGCHGADANCKSCKGTGQLEEEE